jgi:hypothetical protein
MAYGYASDVDGSEKVMDVPDAEVYINLDKLPPMQGERLAVILHKNDVGDLDDETVKEIEMALQKNDKYWDKLPTANIHVDLQNLIMILNEAGIADIPTGVETEDISTTESNEDT